MKCFGFNAVEADAANAGGGISVELCEEIIQFHTVRQEGIPLAANIIIRCMGEGEKYLGIWHRADVSPLSMGETCDWLDPQSFETYIFFNITRGRGRITGPNRTIEMRPFRNGGAKLRLESEAVKGIIVPPVGDGAGAIDVSYPLGDELATLGLKTPDAEFVPYTYVKVGPFAGHKCYYAIRVTTHVSEPAFGRLVTEIPCDNTRVYDVYGADEILRKIQDLDLPDLEYHTEPEVFALYRDHFVNAMKEKRLCPKAYSVVAIDSPDSHNHRPPKMYAIKLTRGLDDLTDQISEDLFKYPALSELRDRVFWFVNRSPKQDFRLQLEGPMSSSDVYAPAGGT